MITDVSEMGTVLGVWGHPDDEAYLSAGIMAKAVDAGQRVVCVTATRGELGFPDDDPRSLDDRAALREAELDECFAILGVTEHHWLDYHDGRCKDVDDDEGAARIGALIEEIRPDTILTFGPDGGTGHDDHIAAGRWSTIAFRRAGLPNSRLFYATRTPEWAEDFLSLVDPQQIMMVDGLPESTPQPDLAIDFVFDDELTDRKVRALLAHKSQVEELAYQGGIENFRRLMGFEFYREATEDDFPGRR
jgi:LmbE family N-acetylglucosaminyl deacetylase